MLQGLPQHWAHANLAMLYKKGDPHSALNYRPISLLNSCYKLIAKWLLAELDGLTTQYHLVHLSQMGGLKCRRTADHIFRVLRALQVHPNSDHLYINLEKAFNSVVRPTLWCLLEHYNLPDELIQCLWLSHRDTLDAPLVLGGGHFVTPSSVVSVRAAPCPPCCLSCT